MANGNSGGRNRWKPCLALAFPALADLIDWSAPPRFLDTELQEIVRDSESGPMRVDKLVEVRRQDGRTELLLVHVEVQAQRDDNLPRRMFQYFCRIFDRFGRPPVSLAVLADPNLHWRPDAFTQTLAGCSLSFQMEGRHTAAQELVLDLVSERFGPCSDALRARVGAIRDESRLRQLARATLTVSTLPEFEARLD